MIKPKISVIIPVYNVERYLLRCLYSVINQTFHDLEIILVDDGSIDNSGTLCDDIQITDNRIKVIHQPNGGQGNARNNGLKIATGKYISFVDSDDYLKQNMYENLYKQIENTNADTCIFGYHKERNGKILYTKINSITGTFKDNEVITNIFLNLLGAEPSYNEDFRILWQSPCFSLYSLELIRKYNISFPNEGEFASFSEDVLYNFDYYIHASNVTIVNEAFYYYCDNQNSTTTSYSEVFFLKNVDLYLEQINRLYRSFENKDFLEKAKERLQRILLAKARYSIMLISGFLSYRKSKKLISDISNNNILQEILHTYPWKRNPLKYKLFNLSFQNKWTWLLYFLGKIKK